jgi:transcriptional regulator with XRE-family HTH domain
MMASYGLKLLDGSNVDSAQENFGTWLLRNRTALKISQPELERRSGVSKQYISNLERNVRTGVGNRNIRPSPEKVGKIIQALLAFGMSTQEVQLGWRAAGYTTPEPQQPVNEDAEIVRNKELLLWMFTDLPRECQLDVMASVSGIHQRRSLSARIVDRHDARAGARAEVNSRSAAMEYQSNTDNRVPVTTSSDEGERSHTATITLEGVEKPQARKSAAARSRPKRRAHR